MQVTVIDNKRKDSIVCSATDAAKTVGVCYRTILRWSYDGKVKEFNRFTLYFNTVKIKQKKRGSMLYN